MKIIFKDNSFAFELVRNLGFMYYGGADLGEMVATSNKIEEGDLESWFKEWDARARRVLSIADASLEGGHLVSAREAYLKASTYFRMAEFYLHGNQDDPRILSEAGASEQAYSKAAELTGPTWQPIQVPYEGTTLPGYFYKVDDSGTPRPTVIFHGGFDSSREELFYFGGAAAVRRGYNCLTFDGPGQGMPIRRDKLVFRNDWEKVVTPAVDFALTLPEVDGDQLVLMGMSMGGYLAPRAAAFEQRFKAAIYFDGIYDFGETARAAMPKEAMAALDAGDKAKFNQIVGDAMHTNTTLRWNMEQGTWTFGVPSYADFIEATREYTMAGIVQNIRCPSLVMDAEADMFFNGQPQKLFDALQCSKKLVKFTTADGAENHCQSGALSYKDQVVFDWLDETLGRRAA